MNLTYQHSKYVFNNKYEEGERITVCESLSHGHYNPLQVFSKQTLKHNFLGFP